MTLAVMGRCSFPSLKVFYQPTFGWEKDTTLDPTYAVGWASPAGSRMTISLDAWGGVVFEGMPPKPLGGWSVMRCLLWERPGGGGGGV